MSALGRIAELLPGRIPRVGVLFVIVGVLLLALFSPNTNGSASFDPRLSSNLSGPNGAKGIYEVARQLGWKTERRNDNPFDSVAAGTIIAVLAPTTPLSERETSLLLERVRDGASLLTVLDNDSHLADSLKLKLGPAYVTVLVEPPAGIDCRAPQSRSVIGIASDKAFLRPFAQRTALPTNSQVFTTSKVSGNEVARFSAIGFPFGKGRIVAVSDPNLLRNDFLRVCKWGLGVTAVRMLEYLSDGRAPGDTRIIFDEFHHGYGPQPSVTRATARFLSTTTWGWTIAQVMVASLLLLLALGPRAIPPVSTPSVQRRSQFEHVEALSSAYQQISATRLVVETLLHGVRRRIGARSLSSLRKSHSDQVFLEQTMVSHPDISPAVTKVLEALSHRVPQSRLLEAVTAIETIERTIKR
ncbi:MAG TPA: DUF4350 domain-containing protein [Gemmatimonadaceae bacterium]